MASVTDNWVGITRLIRSILLLSLLVPSLVMAKEKERPNIYEETAIKEQSEFADAFKPDNILKSIKTRVNSGLSDKESGEVKKLLNLWWDEHALMKIEGKNKATYYITEKTWLFHNRVRIEFNLYRYLEKRVDVLWHKTYEQEGHYSGCASPKISKDIMKPYGKNGKDYPDSIQISKLSHSSDNSMLLQVTLMNCETRRTYTDSILFTASKDFIGISDY